MRSKTIMAISLLCMAMSVSACSSTSEPPTAAAIAVASPPAPGVVAGPIGQSLDEKDRATAIAAQQDAVASGARKSWRGAHGAYGLIMPGPETGSCREYTHKIFINGRPQEAKGQACRENGAWRVTS